MHFYQHVFPTDKIQAADQIHVIIKVKAFITGKQVENIHLETIDTKEKQVARAK